MTKGHQKNYTIYFVKINSKKHPYKYQKCKNKRKTNKKIIYMNYKIKVTPENREAIKDIAARNGMNEIGFNFESPNPMYHIEEGCFTCYPMPPKDTRNYQELTFDQFKAMFDKQETELEKWLRETKAKNLNLRELKIHVAKEETTPEKLYEEIKAKFKAADSHGLAGILYSQWNEPKEEWQPKRGDRVLVWNEKEEDAVERMFLSVIKEIENSILVVTNGYEEDFKANKTISISSYEHMKPLPPTKSEKTFKDKVIELAEKRIEHYKICEKESRENSDEHDAIEYKAIYNQFEDFLYKIKELN